MKLMKYHPTPDLLGQVFPVDLLKTKGSQILSSIATLAAIYDIQNGDKRLFPTVKKEREDQLLKKLRKFVIPDEGYVKIIFTSGYEFVFERFNNEWDRIKLEAEGVMEAEATKDKDENKV